MMDEFILSFAHKCRVKKYYVHILEVLFIVLSFYLCVRHTIGVSASVPSSCEDIQCIHGTCTDGRCICDRGWQGSSCQLCGGRARLSGPSGYISDGVGNYTVDMQCTWLIDSEQQNVTIRLQIIQFETECSWDHLYVFDGDSIFSPLVAAYSGVLLRSGWSSKQLPEIVTYSGSAYLYFYSDAAFNMSGFNISYSINSCPKNCSSHGPCVDDVCTCWAGWTGQACDVPICPHDCVYGFCNREEDECICDEGYRGSDCSIPEKMGWWGEETTSGNTYSRALHASVVLGEHMWVVGGESFHQGVFHNLLRYNFQSKKWETLEANFPQPETRYGHSLVTYGGQLYMYGGTLHNESVTNELWMLDVALQSWSLLKESSSNHECLTEPCSPLSTAGHTANVVDDRMIIFFGYNPVYGYLNTVQQYNFISQKWQLVQTRGAIVKGGYGHTSVYDITSQLIYVYGGVHSFGSDSTLVDLLYSYNPRQHSWKLLAPSKSHRYLHSAAILKGMMLIFGGNVHNGTSSTNGNKCFSSDVVAYDIACDTWNTLNFPVSTDRGISRFGHTSVVYRGSMYAFGGFNGQMLSDILKLTPGVCEQFNSEVLCQKAAVGIKCIWNTEQNSCQAFSLSTPLLDNQPCPHRESNMTSLCRHQTACPSCLENKYGCIWCGTFCSYQTCGKGAKMTVSPEKCEEAESSNCDKLHNCHACHTEYHCGWQVNDKCYTFVKETGTKTEKAVLSDDYRVKCEAPCSTRNTCEECTQGPCMWCSNKKRCIELNAYAVVFPVGQCMEWTTQHWKCPSLVCKDLQTCEQCQRNPECGWCDDGSGTGLGKCMEGSSLGPLVKNGSDFIVENMMCPVERWYFTSCPLCQCNGHSTCLEGSGTCQQPCKHLTEGEHCEQCQPGFYGNPVNGGNCTWCVCNNHGSLCNPQTGVCFCDAKGIVGHHCERCDEANHYTGNPKEKGGSCYYNLSIDFQYTFNMSKPEDRYYNKINFINTPLKTDLDVDFTISCKESPFALLSITLASASKPERVIHENKKCSDSSESVRFPHSEHTFGLDNTTFFVYVYNFTTPVVVKISFSQHKTLDLLQFFVTFSSCFLSLLIIAAVLWKIKLKYDLYRRRQRLFVEMEQLALRPFASVVAEMELVSQKDLVSGDEAGKKIHPTPVALEPCSGGKAAVLSLIVRLPTGDAEYTSAGSCGLALASALVSLGTLQNTEVVKENGELDVWKSRPN